MYFKNLQSVRVIAASLVIVHHIEQLKKLAGLPNHFDNATVYLAGKLGVIVFFALSGFLITSLLLREQQNGGIQLVKFYWRRVLRIWPLYFLVIAVSFGLWFIPAMHVPGTINPFAKLPLNLVLLGGLLSNVQLKLVGPIAFSSQCWSIGVEEQFYLIWPILVGAAAQAARLRFVIFFAIAGFVALKLAYLVLPGMNDLHAISDFLANYLQLDCMMFGVVLAALHATGTARKLLTGTGSQILLYVLFLSLALRGTRFIHIADGALMWDVYAALAALILYNMVQPTSLVNLEFAWLKKLGDWSYGLYMWHILMAWPLIRLVGTSWMLYPLVFACTIVLARCSYQFFELPFLRWKDHFAPEKQLVLQVK